MVGGWWMWVDVVWFDVDGGVIGRVIGCIDGKRFIEWLTEM